MRVSKARVINCLTLGRLVCHLVLWTSFFLMYEGLPQLLLDPTIIMSVLLMLIANLFGFIYCVTNLKFFNAFVISKILLNSNLVARFVLFKQIGGRVSSLELFLPTHRHRTSCVVPTRSSTKWFSRMLARAYCWNGAYSSCSFIFTIEFLGWSFFYSRVPH